MEAWNYKKMENGKAFILSFPESGEEEEKKYGDA